MAGLLEWMEKAENYVCPLLSPECGERGLKNQGCQYGKVCYTVTKSKEVQDA